MASVTPALAALRTAGPGDGSAIRTGGNDDRAPWRRCENAIHCPSAEIDPLARILPLICTAVAETPERIDDGIWRWTARHPEWHPAGFGDEVACSQ